MEFSPKSRRWLWFGALFLFISGFFVAKVPQATRPELAGVSAAFVLVLAAPSFWALGRWLGPKRAALVVVALGLFAFGLETVAILTGLPYGRFVYGDKIGGKIGVVPWTVFFSWSPLVLGASALAARQVQPQGHAKVKGICPWLFRSVLCLLCFDAVLDPGAVQQKFWHYEAGGFYYGVPLSNFLGWVVSGVLGTALFYWLDGQQSEVPIALVASVTLILAFWTSVTLFTGLWVPAMLGALLLGAIALETRAR